MFRRGQLPEARRGREGPPREQGLRGSIVEKELTKVDTKDREELLKVTGREKRSKRVALVTTFSRGLLNISNILRKHLPTLHVSDRMKDAFPEPPLVSYRRDANLKHVENRICTLSIAGRASLTTTLLLS